MIGAIKKLERTGSSTRAVPDSKSSSRTDR